MEYLATKSLDLKRNLVESGEPRTVRFLRTLSHHSVISVLGDNDDRMKIMSTYKQSMVPCPKAVRSNAEEIHTDPSSCINVCNLVFAGGVS